MSLNDLLSSLSTAQLICLSVPFSFIFFRSSHLSDLKSNLIYVSLTLAAVPTSQYPRRYGPQISLKLVLDDRKIHLRRWVIIRVADLRRTSSTEPENFSQQRVSLVWCPRRYGLEEFSVSAPEIDEVREKAVHGGLAGA